MNRITINDRLNRTNSADDAAQPIRKNKKKKRKPTKNNTDGRERAMLSEPMNWCKINLGNSIFVSTYLLDVSISSSPPPSSSLLECIRFDGSVVISCTHIYTYTSTHYCLPSVNNLQFTQYKHIVRSVSAEARTI